MTDIKKKQAGKMAVKARKLQLNKETLKDLSAPPGKGKQVKAGDGPRTASGCCL